MNNVNEKAIDIIVQAYYGNRVGTTISRDRIDSFILGHINGEIPSYEQIDRIIIRLPNEDGIAIVYNKYAEDNGIKFKERALTEGNYAMKPLAIIPELDIELYSRCIACRVDKDDNIISLKSGDYDKVIKYLAE